MSKTTYTVLEVPGSSRKSERPYTHAVIGRHNNAASRATIAADDMKWLRNDYSYWVKLSQCKEGDAHPCGAGTVKADEPASAIKALAGCATFEAFAEQRRARSMAEVTQRYGAGDLGELVVLQWSMSETNARKGMSQFGHYSQLRVVPCVAQEPTKKTKA